MCKCDTNIFSSQLLTYSCLTIRRYSFKTKKRKPNEQDEEHELEESVRTLTSLLSRAHGGAMPGIDLGAHNAHIHGQPHLQAYVHGAAGRNNATTVSSADDEPLEARVAAISAEIAAVIAQAQAQSRLYQEGVDDDEDDDGEGETGPESGEGEADGEAEAEWLGPLVSGIRNEPDRAGVPPPSLGNSGTADDDDDGDDFPVPLRQRRQNNTTVAVSSGLKRKR